MPVLFANNSRKVLDVDLLDPIILSRCNTHLTQVQVRRGQEDPIIAEQVQGTDHSATAEDLLSEFGGSDSELRKLLQHSAVGGNSPPSGQRSNSLVASKFAGLCGRAKVVTDKPTAETLERGAELKGLVITRCVQHKNKVFFIFTHVNGSNGRSLSQPQRRNGWGSKPQWQLMSNGIKTNMA